MRKALKQDATAEFRLYERHAPKMLSVCRYYIKDLHYAEDVMVVGFTKVFEHLGRFRFEGSFEGWVRRIMVREAIDFLRGRRQLQFSELDDAAELSVYPEEGDLDAESLQLMIDALPTGYKTVMVLFAIEGYSHKEIAEMLQISESTSKSQLFKARKMLTEQLTQTKMRENGIL